MALFSAVVSAIINEMPLLLVLLVMFVSGAKRVWIWGRELQRAEAQLTDERIDFMRQLNEMREEKNQWRAAALWTMGHPSFRGKPPPDIPEIEEV